jgi:hypothetical protein
MFFCLNPRGESFALVPLLDTYQFCFLRSYCL